MALITGASSGMGKAFAKALLAEGLIVYAAARRVDHMDDLVTLGAIAIKMDITRDDDVQAAVKRIEEDHGSVDVLINNAGFGLYGAMEETSLADARYQFEVNLFGMARLTQLLLPAMRKKRAGKIINISSMGGKIYTPLGSWYHATKHAIEGWSDCLRLELNPFNIDVVIIEPGVIATEFGSVMMNPMLERSGAGPYSKMAHAIASATKASYEKGAASDPQVIVDLMVKAIRADKPKTRYVAGKYAKPMMFIRKWLGDRVFDKVILSAVK
ncbi:oxidoreductase [Dyella lipolytica]|uniref:oxidoreductase n=1 Tax=Dyella lipolytica TaxID=1867835 RepID=UPI0024E0C0AE|nr:oxidoreductase [Dyella lipolytica]